MQSNKNVARFTKEIAPLILTGPPAVTGFAGGRPKVEEIMAYFPALIPPKSRDHRGLVIYNEIENAN